ncbi:MFS transporter [Endozoicomonas sp. 8E]|uniref:MFS transporter n=1 Tax=Endozoicomonas sp. 8E TaxID=3035692 RepID=UPI00293935B7|nr:MFS transporter [Endozoicomonas sp. 8E]WOG29429.1 MFS transporter [Endozoicomonas sp. 8E]
MPRCITAPSEQYKLALAVSMGGMLELYDFLIYALMASYIAGHFFPASDQLTSLLGTFAAFAAGYLTRPLGGLFFGHLGDRFGRKKTFTLTIFLMALTTALMGCLPTYKEVGVVAPLLLVLLRLTQGFSLGGELPGAITYLSESVPQRQGLMIGILFLALMTGISLGTFLLGLLNLLLGEEAMAQWGWRMPFWIGGLLGLFSYHIRRRFDDSGLFVALDQVRQRSTIPLILLLREHRKGLFCGLLLMALCGATVTVYGVYMPSYLSSILDLPRANVVWRTAVAFLVLSPLSLVAGILTDIVNKRLLATCMALAVIVLSFPTFQYFVTESPPIRRIMMTCGLFTALASGLLPPVIVRFFPTEVRYTGIATSYNFGFAIFGGLAPFSSTLIVQKTGFTLGPAYYLAVIGIISLIAVLIPWPDYDMEKNECPGTKPAEKG